MYLSWQLNMHVGTPVLGGLYTKQCENIRWVGSLGICWFCLPNIPKFKCNLADPIVAQNFRDEHCEMLNNPFVQACLSVLCIVLPSLSFCAPCRITQFCWLLQSHIKFEPMTSQKRIENYTNNIILGTESKMTLFFSNL